MANNCYNFITICGNEKEISEFSKLLELTPENKQENGIEIYENLITEFCEGKLEFFDGNSRWFDIEQQEGQDKNNIVLSGDSAWNPALKLFTKISERYPSFEIRYEYEESGNDFAGFANISKGNCEDNCFPYWEGVIKTQGESEAVVMVIQNELSGYETKKELKESDMFKSFSKENKKEILTYFENE